MMRYKIEDYATALKVMNTESDNERYKPYSNESSIALNQLTNTVYGTISEYLENGEPIIDENGNTIPIPEVDDEGNVVLDDEGNPVYQRTLGLVHKVEEANERIIANTTAIEQTERDIKLKASQTDLDKLTNRVSDAESSITVQHDLIESKVSRDGIISAIVQSPESIKISADKIDITGAVTFNAFDTALQNKINSKADTSDIPTKVSELTNDSNFTTIDDVESKGYATTEQVDAAKTEAIDIASEDATNKTASVQADVDSANDSIIDVMETFNTSFEELNSALDVTVQDTIDLKESLNNILGYITIDPSIPRIKVAINDDNYFNIEADKVAFITDGNENSYMANDRFYSPSSVVTNLYMQVRDPESDEMIGNLAWIARANGHLTLKRAR